MAGRFERQLTAEYKERCHAMRDSLRFRSVVTEAEIAAYWPGGEENKGGGVRAWIFAYASLVRFCDRIDESAGESRSRQQDDDVLAALTDASETVTLSDGVEMRCYPKSFVALRHIQTLEDRIRWMLERRETLARFQGAEELDFLARVDEAITRDYQLIAMTATSEGVKLPFGPFDSAIEIPERVQNLTPVDYLLVYKAFQGANAVRLQVLMSMLDKLSGADGGTRANWSTFFATRSEDSHLPASALMADRSLVSQIASALLTADARKIPDDKKDVA